MFGLKNKPSEGDLELAILYAALHARANEGDQSRLSTREEIETFLGLAFKEKKIYPDGEQRRLARMSVDSLLLENVFINELLQLHLSNPRASLPTDSRDRMLAAIEKAVKEFIESR
jgi:hypothetical protein